MTAITLHGAALSGHTHRVALLLNALGTPFPPVVHLFRLALLFTVASALHYVYLASTKGGTVPAP